MKKRYCSVFLTVLVSVVMGAAAQAGFAVNDAAATTAVYSSNKPGVIPQFLSKEQAVAIEEKTQALIVVSDAPGFAEYTDLKEVPEKGVFIYYNPYSNKIGVAPVKKESIALAQISRELFYAEKGEKLSDTVQRWVSTAQSKECQQYTLFWDVDYDYMLQYSSSFYGSLLEEEGALDKLLKSFQQKDYALQAEVTDNCVVIIRPLSYKQQSVVGV